MSIQMLSPPSHSLCRVRSPVSSPLSSSPPPPPPPSLLPRHLNVSIGVRGKFPSVRYIHEHLDIVPIVFAGCVVIAPPPPPPPPRGPLSLPPPRSLVARMEAQGKHSGIRYIHEHPDSLFAGCVVPCHPPPPPPPPASCVFGELRAPIRRLVQNHKVSCMSINIQQSYSIPSLGIQAAPSGKLLQLLLPSCPCSLCQ